MFLAFWVVSMSSAEGHCTIIWWLIMSLFVGALWETLTLTAEIESLAFPQRKPSQSKSKTKSPFQSKQRTPPRSQNQKEGTPNHQKGVRNFPNPAKTAKSGITRHIRIQIRIFWREIELQGLRKRRLNKSFYGSSARRSRFFLMALVESTQDRYSIKFQCIQVHHVCAILKQSMGRSKKRFVK